MILYHAVSHPPVREKSVEGDARRTAANHRAQARRDRAEWQDSRARTCRVRQYRTERIVVQHCGQRSRYEQDHARRRCRRGRLASLLDPFGELFANAEIKAFRTDKLEQARAWIDARASLPS